MPDSNHPTDPEPHDSASSALPVEIAHLVRLPRHVVRALRRLALILGLAAIALSLLGTRYGWLDYKPGGSAFDSEIRPVFTVFFAVALLIALRWQIVGGVLAAFAGAALIASATNQLVAVHAVLVIASLAVPAALWVLVDLNELRRSVALVGLGFAAVATVTGYLVGEGVYDHLWGPTHPASAVPALPPSGLEWIWVGDVTTDSAEVRATPSNDVTRARLAVSIEADLRQPQWFDAFDISGRVIGFAPSGLEPNTVYHYAVELDGVLDEVRVGQFQTFPDGAASYTVAVGSCARVGSNGAVFDTIRELDPLLYLITGDLHYGDNGRNDLGRYQEVMDLTLDEPAQSALYRSTAIAYMWDDHDYGGNNADGSSPSRQAAMAAYREYVPSYDLTGDESAVYQAFTIGRVRYILTDARSARNLDNSDNSDAPSMLGAEQKAWFKDEVLAASNTNALVVWVNPVPWVADAQDGADHWGGFDAERRELANFLVDNEVDNLLMISGDAHMVAIDDGTNTNYSDQPGPGFPLLHAAALDRPGSIKGGPYSEGAIDGGGQFATIDIDDDGQITQLKHDDMGRLKSKVGPSDEWKYTHDSMGRLLSTHRNSKLMASMDYNASGQRVRKVENVDGEFVTTWYVSPNYELREDSRDPGNIVPTVIVDGGGNGVVATETVEALIDAPNEDVISAAWGNPLAVGHAGGAPVGVYFHHHNHLGSTSIITDASGTVVSIYRNTPWGERKEGGTGFDIASREFTGQVRDEQTELLYYGARYYDPDVGRFLEPDTDDLGMPFFPDVDSMNRHTYVKNNPVRYTDPTGHQDVDKGEAVFKDLEAYVRTLETDPTIQPDLPVVKQQAPEPGVIDSVRGWFKKHLNINLDLGVKAKVGPREGGEGLEMEERGYGSPSVDFKAGAATVSVSAGVDNKGDIKGKIAAGLKQKVAKIASVTAQVFLEAGVNDEKMIVVTPGVAVGAGVSLGRVNTTVGGSLRGSEVVVGELPGRQMARGVRHDFDPANRFEQQGL